MASITDFKNRLSGGGARANQFRVMLNFPQWVPLAMPAGDDAQFLCKSSSLPGSFISDIPVQYRGRELHVAGERSFQPWTLTFYNDTNFHIRSAFEQWQAGIQSYTNTSGATNPRSYQVQMTVYQLDRNGAAIKTYQFVNVFPTVVGAIQLDYDAANQIETFDVEFTYDYFMTSAGIGGAATDLDSVGIQGAINIGTDLSTGSVAFGASVGGIGVTAGGTFGF
jgi:hypothetical protein